MIFTGMKESGEDYKSSIKNHCVEKEHKFYEPPTISFFLVFSIIIVLSVEI